jgi:hypothetical protein
MSDNGEGGYISMKQIILVVIAIILFLGIGLFGLQYTNKQKNSITKVAKTAPDETEPITTIAPSLETSNMGAVESTLVLQLTAPINNSVVSTSSIVVKGKTAPLADVFVNDKETKADANGLFSLSMTLDEGENTILVVANDSDGRVGETEATVTYTAVE